MVPQSFDEVWRATQKALSTIGAAHETRWFITWFFNRPLSALMNSQVPILSDLHQRQAFQATLARRLNGEPLAYLIGLAPFMGEDFVVNGDTLIPREDSECLVHCVLSLIEEQKPASTECFNILELGVGSGALLCMVGKLLSAQELAVNLWGTDISDNALSVARDNLSRHGVAAQLAIADWWSGLPEAMSALRFNVVFANPPYIHADDPHLQGDGVRHEPRTALVSGNLNASEDGQGLADINALINTTPPWIAPNGALALEHGHKQGEAVRRLLHQRGWVQIETIHDEGGRERVSFGRWPHH